MARYRRTMGNRMKIHEIFGENRLKFGEKMKDHQHLKKDFHGEGKSKIPA